MGTLFAGRSKTTIGGGGILLTEVKEGVTFMSEDQGILFFIGIIIIGICIGTIFSAVYGWLTIGSLFIFTAIIDRIWTSRDKKRKGK